MQFCKEKFEYKLLCIFLMHGEINVFEVKAFVSENTSLKQKDDDKGHLFVKEEA